MVLSVMNCVDLDKPAYATLEASNVVKQTEALNYHCCPAAWEDQLDQIDHDEDIVYSDLGHGDGDSDGDGDHADLPSSSLQWLQRFFPLTLNTRSCRSPLSPSRGGTCSTRLSSH